MIRMPNEDGAWYMALTCWIAGWGAAFRLAWQPLAIAMAVVSAFAAAQAFRSFRRWWVPDRPAALRKLPVAILGSILPLGVVFLLPDWTWVAILAAPAILYAPFLVTGKERHPAARVIAVVALSGVTPATYAAAAGHFGWTAAILWASLGGYFLIGAVFVMARFRKSRAALWVARVTATAAFGAALSYSWILSAAFLLLAARAWAHRPAGTVANPKRAGNIELAFSTAAAAIILVGIWLR